MAWVKGLVPALDRGAADAVRTGQLALAHPALVGLEDLQAVRLGGAQPRADSSKPVPEIAVAADAVVLGHRQVQHHELIALAGVLDVTAGVILTH
jgi:hypothetical protein